MDTHSEPAPHWLDRYASNYHAWRRVVVAGDGSVYFSRRQGLIEAAFDADGRYWGGRADVSSQLRLKAAFSLSKEALQERIVLAWTALRLSHVLLTARATLGGGGQTDLYFEVPCFNSAESAIAEARKRITFVEDRGGRLVDDDEFYLHLKNTSRVLDPAQSLCHLFVAPARPAGPTQQRLTFFFEQAHQITDGLTSRVWSEHFLHLLNTPLARLRATVDGLCNESATQARLPRPQEDLYPPISGSKARRRWFWVLSLVLRHIRTPLPAAFSNPLRREKPLTDSHAFPPKFSDYLDYSSKPPLNTFIVRAAVPERARDRIVKLCRQAKASVGAGGFALVAMVMMLLHERKCPGGPSGSHRPFVSGFPINPRPFFNHKSPPDSLMLSFCDGISLPFLPSHLDLDGRFRLLARHAQRQLSAFQKRQRPEDASDPLAYMGSRGAGRVIATTYISSVERQQLKLPEHVRKVVQSPQGALEARPNASMQTCGVSSIGRTTQKPGMYDLSKPVGQGEDNFVADWWDLMGCVRVRDGEFLVGIVGYDASIGVGVSCDGNAIDEEQADAFKKILESLFDGESSGVQQRSLL